MYLSLAEFSYVHNHHSIIKYVACERGCRSPVLWTKVGSSQLISPELVRGTMNEVSDLRET